MRPFRTLSALAFLSAALGQPLRAETWRIIVLPDTQHYVNIDNDLDGDGTPDYLHHFQAQINWIVANKEPLNIVFVSHVGDIVQRVHLQRPPTEWLSADAVMSGLDGVVPYGAVAGNHDILNSGLFPFNYIVFFGPTRYQSYPWYGGSSPNELSHYQNFQVKGDYGTYYFTHISMEWQCPGSPSDPSTSMGWVQQVIDQHSFQRNILISTHAALDTNGQFPDENFGLANENSPFMVKQLLFEPNAKVIDMIFNGHYHTPTDGAQMVEIKGNTPVMLSNYQEFPEGGMGYLRIVEFIEGGGAGGLDRIHVQTYSPSLDQNLTDPENDFVLDRDFKKMFRPLPDSGAPPRPPRGGVTPP